MAHPLFPVSARVRLRASPQDQGRIVDVRPYKGGFQYLALIGGHENWYAEADLERVSEREFRWQKHDDFLRDMMIAKMRHPIADNLYAYRASRTVFEPYQFRPALKFLHNPDQRILIADEVGLGKTIEAAIIYLELKARANIGRVLVLCPARLKRKWIDELRNRFDEEFEDLNPNGLRRIFTQYDRSGTVSFRGVASYESFRRDELVDEMLERQIQLDLLIVDEAHYMRNSGTATYRLGTALTDLADAVVFLTATPLHLKNEDLYHLLHLLLPGEYSDSRIFEQQIFPNQFINRAAQYLAAGKLEEACQTLRWVERTLMRERFTNSPYYHEIVEGLQQPALSRDSRVNLQRSLLELNTLSSVFTRTRKREVVGGAVRAPVSVMVQFSPEERAFYQGILNQVRRELLWAGSSVHGFTIIAKERMAASCLPAVRSMFEESVRQGMAVSAQYESSWFGFEVDDDIQVDSTDDLLRLSRRIGNKDTKFDLFKQALDQALAESPDSKALVFSFYKRTLAYLYRRLREAGYTVEVIHGDIAIPDRQEIIDQFRTDPRLRILLSSEVGAEGLDFQFCDVLMNYDLPWNPMQVEQRIGRLDRFGQKHPRIRIYNFFIEDTVEDRVFQRLYDRIEIFKSSIGDLEDILGEQIRELSRHVLQAALTPQEEIEMAEQAAERIVQRQIANQELEAHKDEFLGQDSIFNQQVNDAVSSGRVIHAEEVRALVQTFLCHCFNFIEFTRDPVEPAYTLTITPDLKAYLQEFTHRNPTLHYTTGSRFKQAMGFNKQVALTFDADLARERNLLEFVTHQHLLAQAALEYWAKTLVDGKIPASKIVIDGQNDEHGDGFFFIYSLEEQGLTLRRTLHPVIIFDDGTFATESAKTLFSQLLNQSGRVDNLDAGNGFISSQETLANNWIAEQRDRISIQANKRHSALINIRAASITESYDAKIRRAQQTLQAVSEARIVRMYEGQIRNLEAQRDRKLKELREKDHVSVSHSLIAAGRVRVMQVVSIGQEVQLTPAAVVVAPSPLEAVESVTMPTSHPLPEPVIERPTSVSPEPLSEQDRLIVSPELTARSYARSEELPAEDEQSTPVEMMAASLGEVSSEPMSEWETVPTAEPTHEKIEQREESLSSENRTKDRNFASLLRRVGRTAKHLSPRRK